MFIYIIYFWRVSKLRHAINVFFILLSCHQSYNLNSVDIIYKKILIFNIENSWKFYIVAYLTFINFMLELWRQGILQPQVLISVTIL